MERNHTPQHGNYHNYYAKRSPSSPDPRLALLPRGFFVGKRVLDVGCNEGYVTLEIAQHSAASEVLGVDLDQELVRRARERRAVVWSLQEPALHNANLPQPSGSDSDDSDFERPTNGSARRKGKGSTYFPQSMPYMFGPFAVPPPPASHAPQFPHNINFKHCNYAISSLPEDAEGWDRILLLSILKWIHLNTLDQGLLAFFHKCFAALRPGGGLVLELQAWEGYRQAARGNARLKENLKRLQLRPEGFESLLLGEVGFGRVEHLGVAGEGGFRSARKVDVYWKE